MFTRNSLRFKRPSLVSLLAALLVVGCSAPRYALMPDFQRHKDSIQTIAICPLYLSNEKDEEAQLFAPVFNQAFLDSLKTISFVRPIEFISPDSTVSLLKAANIPMIADSEIARTEVVAYTSSGGKITVYGLPKRVTEAISQQSDALLFCNLITYNEVTSGTAFAQGMVTACLTLGTVVVMEKPIAKINISLVETTTGSKMWVYERTTEVSAAKSLEGQRISMTEDIIDGFKKCFPFIKKEDAK